MEALKRVAILLAETGRISAARRLFEAQLRRRPPDAWTRTLLAHLLQEAGKIEAAQAAYGVALRHDPHLPAAHEGREPQPSGRGIGRRSSSPRCA
ncbi:MAG: tetratricopeptide repeat protein [Clostridia bacterium]